MMLAGAEATPLYHPEYKESIRTLRRTGNRPRFLDLSPELEGPSDLTCSALAQACDTFLRPRTFAYPNGSFKASRSCLPTFLSFFSPASTNQTLACGREYLVLRSCPARTSVRFALRQPFQQEYRLSQFLVALEIEKNPLGMAALSDNDRASILVQRPEEP